MTDESLTPVERIRVHLASDHHEEDAEAFSIVDSLIQNYLLPDISLTQDAMDLSNMLLDVVGSWTPPRRCAGCGEQDALDDGLCQSCVNHQHDHQEKLRVRIAGLEALLRECGTTLAMWADVAPAVSLRADIDKILNK